MNLEEYKAEYGGMKAAEVRSLIASSPAFRAETERIYYSIYRKRLNKSCGDCWMDAYILIMRGDPEKQKKMMNKRYDLRAGVVLVDPHGDRAKMITTHNITDELAVYHLRTHPSCVRLFSVLPENWEEDVYGKQEDNSDLDGMSAEKEAAEAAEQAEKERAEAEAAEAERLAKEKAAAAEAAANAGAPADESKAQAPADAPAEEEKAAEGKKKTESKKK